MSISAAPFQLFVCACPYPAHTSLDVDVELQHFVFPVILIKWFPLPEIPEWQHRPVIWTQNSKPVERENTFSDGIHFPFKEFLSQMSLCHHLLPHLPCRSEFVWVLVINIYFFLKAGGFLLLFLHRIQEFKGFRATVKHSSYWVELHSSFLAKEKTRYCLCFFCPSSHLSSSSPQIWVRPMREDESNFELFGLLWSWGSSS